MGPGVVIDSSKSHLQCLGPLTEWVCALKHLVPTRLDLEATTLLKMLNHLVEDVEDPADGAEDPRDGVEALVGDGEVLDGLEK